MITTITATTENGLIVSQTTTRDDVIKDFAVAKYTADGYKVIIHIED